MKKVIIHIIELFHLLLALSLMIGGYIIPKEYIPIFLLSTPYLVIDWNDTDGSCWLTKLRNMVHYQSTDPNVDDEIENQFLNGIFRKMGLVVKEETFEFILYIILYASWLYAYVRFMKQYKIKIMPNKSTEYFVTFMVIGWILVTLPSLKKFN
tara:strand:+ start:1565 stop:2023 length:459 start_codon:yes stop_codon:yes gene_type:complete